MQTTDEGTYLEIDDRPAVRFERIYDHPVDRVWQAITDPNEMSHWFPSPEIDYEPRAGGRITLGGDPYAPGRDVRRGCWCGSRRTGSPSSGRPTSCTSR